MDTVIAQYLNDQQVGSYGQAGANIFTHPVLPPSQYVPHEAVFITSPTGGSRPSRNFDDTEIRYIALNLRVRGDIDDYSGGKDFAQQIFDTLESCRLEITVKCLQSTPVWIGYDGENHPMWSINIEVWKEFNY